MEVYVFSTTLSDGSQVWGVKVFCMDRPIVFSCVDEKHAMNIKYELDRCVEIVVA